MQLRCVAIDDEPLALELIREYVSRNPGLTLVQTFEDAISGAEFLRHTNIDLLFIDINMPDVNGLDLVRSLQERPMIIFTTAYKKFAIDGFELDALDYLLKPIQYHRFERAVQKAFEYYRYKKSPLGEVQENIFVRSEYRMVRIELSQIEFIESLEDYLKIHFSDKSYVLTIMTMKAMLEKLPASKFRRIHRSYIVPIAKVKSVVNRKVRLSSLELPVSDSYLDFIEAWMKK
ncbi:MAG TPA: LytTR family DNA-binding domain-containing protein [Puia sp.]|nr:LytTR family DNA-binding domain-containing protein [Puia sp.]